MLSYEPTPLHPLPANRVNTVSHVFVNMCIGMFLVVMMVMVVVCQVLKECVNVPTRFAENLHKAHKERHTTRQDESTPDGREAKTGAKGI